MNKETWTRPLCIRCDRPMNPACKIADDEKEKFAMYAWMLPSGGVTLRGGSNYGSTVYDAMIDGVGLEVILCDECIVSVRKQGGFIHEVRMPTFADMALSDDHDTIDAIENIQRRGVS